MKLLNSSLEFFLLPGKNKRISKGIKKRKVSIILEPRHTKRVLNVYADSESSGGTTRIVSELSLFARAIDSLRKI